MYCDKAQYIGGIYFLVLAFLLQLTREKTINVTQPNKFRYSESNRDRRHILCRNIKFSTVLDHLTLYENRHNGLQLQKKIHWIFCMKRASDEINPASNFCRPIFHFLNFASRWEKWLLHFPAWISFSPLSWEPTAISSVLVFTVATIEGIWVPKGYFENPAYSIRKVHFE